MLSVLIPLITAAVCSGEVRGLGFVDWLCTECRLRRASQKQISQEAAKAGVMVLIAGGNVVRFAPALNVSEEG